MDTITIGGDLTVGRLGFGAMRITGEGVWGPPRDPDGARALVRRAVDLGVTFIDTADAYGPDVSEELIAEALHPYTDGVVVATKGGLLRPGPGRWTPCGRPDHLRAACHGSLRRLRLERIDLYQLHAPDPEVPFDESVGELARLRDEGKIRHVGLSNVDAAQLRAAQAVVPVVSVQNRYNVTDRASEPVLEACERDRIAFIPWFPLVAGDLDGVSSVAAEIGITPSQALLAWLLHRSGVMVPIPGTSSVAHLEENAAAAEVRLTDDQADAIASARVA